MTTNILPSPQQPENEVSRNRSAFLLGLYIAIPAVDAIVEPLVQLSDILPISKVMLLDAALSRLEEFDLRSSDYGADVNRRPVSLDMLSYMSRQKIKTIAGLLWQGQTELAHWYQAGNAIGALIVTCDEQRRHPSSQAVAFAKLCLDQAASHLGKQVIPDNGSALADWLKNLAVEIPTDCEGAGAQPEEGAEVGQSLREELGVTEPIVVHSDENHQLRIVETLAAQLRDRKEDTRAKVERQLDARNQYIYERFSAGLNANEVRVLTNQRIEREGLPWEKLAGKADVRRIAVQYAKKFARPALPKAKAGRPRKETPN